MTTETTDTTTETTTEPARSSLVDALFDLGITWAEYGLGQGRAALENSARALQKTAKTLESLQRAIANDPHDKAA